MKRIVGISVLGLLLLFSNMALAERDGNDLLSQCSVALNIFDEPSRSPTLEDFQNQAHCFGVMGGMLGLNKMYQPLFGKLSLFCAPDGISSGQGAQIVVKYLKSHPESLHLNYIMLAVRAFKESYPCK